MGDIYIFLFDSRSKSAPTLYLLILCQRNVIYHFKEREDNTFFPRSNLAQEI